MARFIWIGILLLVGILIAVNPGTDIIMAPHVSKQLKQVGDNYTVETVRCLNYFELFGDVYIYDFDVPKHISQTTLSTRAICPANTLFYHNHPPTNYFNGKVREYYRKYSGKLMKDFDQFLYLSGPDIRSTFINKFPYVFVATNGEYAWWSYEQVREAYLKQKHILLAIEDQHTKDNNDYTITYPLE